MFSFSQHFFPSRLFFQLPSLYRIGLISSPCPSPTPLPQHCWPSRLRHQSRSLVIWFPSQIFRLFPPSFLFMTPNMLFFPISLGKWSSWIPLSFSPYVGPPSPVSFPISWFPFPACILEFYSLQLTIRRYTFLQCRDFFTLSPISWVFWNWHNSFFFSFERFSPVWAVYTSDRMPPLFWPFIPQVYTFLPPSNVEMLPLPKPLMASWTFFYPGCIFSFSRSAEFFFPKSLEGVLLLQPFFLHVSR